jgi:uncharacterized protein (TIGR03437 family)
VSADVTGPAIRLRTRGLGEALDIDTHTLVPKPRIDAVVNAASYEPNIASGGAVTIFGRNLCPDEAMPRPGTQMLEAYGCSVTLDGSALPMLFADAAQINAQVPFSYSGSGTLRVITPNGTVETSIHVNPVAPMLFANPQTPGVALATRPGGALIDAEVPARASETVTLLLTGLGAVQGSLNLGQLPPAPLAVRATIHAKVGDGEVPVISAVLSTGAVGVYEVSLVMPPASGQSLVTVQVVAGGIPSNILSLPVTP